MIRHPATFAILVGGAIAGALDITYAILYSAWRGVAPTRLLQSVASGLIGTAAFAGGSRTAALGLALHFLIAFSIATVYFLASRRWPVLVTRPVLSGILYGVVVYAVMNLVVIPLSATPPRKTIYPLTLATGLLVHMLFIGLPIALAARHALAGRPRRA
ncbi:MAG: hypothetical protein H0W68_00445 [Gemmatimonadaceae bacterium]|nr:hypothetical protein [Gemmatimonadaceae bacterium]